MPPVAVTNLVAQHDVVAPTQPFEFILGHHVDGATFRLAHRGYRTRRQFEICARAGRAPLVGLNGAAAFPIDVFRDHMLDLEFAIIIVVELLWRQLPLLKRHRKLIGLCLERRHPVPCVARHFDNHDYRGSNQSYL